MSLDNSKLANNVSFSEWKDVNHEHPFTSIDYLFHMFKLNGLHTDLLFCFINLLNPEFEIIGDHIYLQEFFDEDIYQRYKSENMADQEIQMWLNLIEITGIFDTVSDKDALTLAAIIVKSWSAKIRREGFLAKGTPRAIHDKETGEIFVTIDGSI